MDLNRSLLHFYYILITFITLLLFSMDIKSSPSQLDHHPRTSPTNPSSSLRWVYTPAPKSFTASMGLPAPFGNLEICKDHLPVHSGPGRCYCHGGVGPRLLSDNKAAHALKGVAGWGPACYNCWCGNNTRIHEQLLGGSCPVTRLPL